MKKIVAAAVAGLLLAGAAFADTAFSWTRTGIVGGTSKKWSKVASNDCLNLELSTDSAGVVFDWDIDGSDALVLDQYYGWMTFGLPLGNLQVTSGKWASRYVDRVKYDAGDLDAVYYEAYKPGIISLDGDSDKIALGADSDNLTLGEMGTIFAYTLSDTLPGTLLVKGGIIDTCGRDYGRFDSASGFAGEIAFRVEDVINLNLAARTVADSRTTVAFFVSPLMLDELRATAGFTYAAYNGDNEIAVDLRARYAVTEKTAVTGMFNYTNISEDLSGAEDGIQRLWAMLSVNHVAGDNIRFLATIQNTIRDFDAKKGKNLTAFTPACEITISESAVFTGAFDIRWDNVTPYAGIGDVSIPLYVTLSL